jgi:hypothetical protein
MYIPSRSDSDSEGENPERKKLQEQLMGECVCLLFHMSAVKTVSLMYMKEINLDASLILVLVQVPL